jgi:hypothetical protein
MIRPEFKATLLEQRGAAVILWSCFTIAVVLYIVIARSILGNPRFSRGLSFADSARMVLWILTLIDIGYYVYWKKKRLSDEAVLTEEPSKLLRAVEEYRGDTERRAAEVVSTYVTRKIVLFAIIEAIAVYGIVLAIVGGFVMDQYVLSAVSLILLVLEFPSETPLARLVQRIEGSS